MAGEGDRRKEPPRLPDSTREIARWESRGDTIKVELQRYGQSEVVAVRRWYPTEDGLKPGRSGMSFGTDDLVKLTAAIEAARSVMGGPSPVAEIAAPAPARPSVLQLSPDGADLPQRVAAKVPPRPPIADTRPSGSTSGLSTRIVRPPLAVAAPSAGSSVAPGQTVSSSVPPVPAATRLPASGPNGATVHDLAAARPPEAPATELPVGPRDRTGVTLSDIIAKKLVRAPLALRIKTRQGVVSGVAYEDGNIVFGNRRFRSPREAYCAITGHRHVVDAWQRLTYRNPVTQRFAKLSRLRNLYLGLEEEDGDVDDE